MDAAAMREQVADGDALSISDTRKPGFDGLIQLDLSRFYRFHDHDGREGFGDRTDPIAGMCIGLSAGFLVCPSCRSLVQRLTLFEYRDAAHEPMVGVDPIEVPVQFCGIQ